MIEAEGARSRIAIVAQTPFHLFSAVLIRNLCGVDADLWLLDPSLRAYQQRCEDLGVWRNVFYAEINQEVVGALDFKAKVMRLRRVRSLQRRITAYLERTRPSAVVIFADNHEITAAFARLGKSIAGARIVMVEEGTAVYFSFRSVRAGLFRRWLRRVIRIDNPDGYSVGWSPNVDAIVVSHPELAHADYLQRRELFRFPPGPYPSRAVAEFLRLTELPIETLTGRDIVLLGQPWVEIGALSVGEESELLKSLDCASLARRVLLKPHPFEPEGKYRFLSNIRVTDEKLRRVPAEIIFEKIRPSVVISVFSSAVVNYCLRYKRPGILLAIAGLPEDVRRFMTEKLPSGATIKIVHNIGELIAAIESALAEGNPAAPEESAPFDAWSRVVRRALALET
jgi:hypothetical protein